MHEVLALAKRENYRVNLIEAYDQPWKRQLEGTVGGHWGLYDAYRRQAKFAWGGAVSNHPNWRWQAAGGVGLAAMVFAAALAAGRRAKVVAAKVVADRALWPSVTVIAAVSGATIGWTIENVPLESLTTGDWLRSLAWAAVALASPIAGAAAIACGARMPSLAVTLGRRSVRPRDPLVLALGALLIGLVVLSVQGALGLVFDARYRDFPCAPLAGAVIPFVILGGYSGAWKLRFKAPAAETAFGATLATAAIYIALSESLANWQALWFSGALLLLAFTLLRAPDAPG
jgi:glucan 1,3-beta-glucosidase